MNASADSSWQDNRVRDFLDALASRAPTPGGGAAAAAAGAIACALGRMVAAFSITAKTPAAKAALVERALKRLGRAEGVLTELVDEDMRAYGLYSQTKTRAGEDRQAAALLPALVETMTVVPLAMAAAAAETLEILEELARLASRWMLSDLAASAILAEATVRAAGCSVRVNLPQLPDGSKAISLAEQIQRLEAGADRRLVTIQAALAGRIE